MKNIFVNKILKYDPTFNKKLSRYAGYQLITLQKADPGILINSRLLKYDIKPVDKIIASSLRRGIESADIFARKLKVKDVITSDLPKEIKFDLNKLVSEEEFNRFGSSLVRERFIDAFISDKLGESRKEIRRRIDNLINLLKSENKKSVLVVSHSFFMKIFQAYLINSMLFEDPVRLSDYIDIDEKTYNFGEGFSFKLND